MALAWDWLLGGWKELWVADTILGLSPLALATLDSFYLNISCCLGLTVFCLFIETCDKFLTIGSLDTFSDYKNLLPAAEFPISPLL